MKPKNLGCSLLVEIQPLIISREHGFLYLCRAASERKAAMRNSAPTFVRCGVVISFSDGILGLLFDVR